MKQHLESQKSNYIIVVFKHNTNITEVFFQSFNKVTHIITCDILYIKLCTNKYMYIITTVVNSFNSHFMLPKLKRSLNVTKLVTVVVKSPKCYVTNINIRVNYVLRNLLI